MEIKIKSQYVRKTKLICNTWHRVSGQSLFEVILAIGITALVLVGALSLSTTSLRNSTFSKNDTIATKYAQVGTEWLREQRDEDFANLTSRVGGIRCISEPPAWGGNGLCSIGDGFARGVTLSLVSPNEVNALVVVQWSDGQGTHEVRSATTFTNWR